MCLCVCAHVWEGRGVRMCGRGGVCACVGGEGRGRGGCGTLSILTSIWNKSPFESCFFGGELM